MAWYDDKNKVNHVTTYKNANEASKEIDRAGKKDWIVSETTTTQGHTNIARTFVKASLVVPFLLGGASRAGDTVTITYARSPEWHAKRRK